MRQPQDRRNEKKEINCIILTGNNYSGFGGQIKVNLYLAFYC